MSKRYRTKLGKRIKILRESKSISREQLGLKVGISGSYVGMIERGENDFKFSKLYSIAKALDISLKELFDFD